MATFIRFDSVGGASGDMILASLAGLGADLAAIEDALNRMLPVRIRLQAHPASDRGLHGLALSVLSEDGVGLDEGAERWPDAWPQARSPSPASASNSHHAHDHAHHDHAHHDHAHHDHAHHDHAHAHDHIRQQHAAHLDAPANHHGCGLIEIERLLAAAPLSDSVRSLTAAVFRALAEAEAEIHGKTTETVHFHEVGAWDSIADIVGSCLALEQLGVVGVGCGPLPAGIGTIRCAHGEMPNPAPATQLLLAGLTISQTDEPFELVTPTAAALLRVWTRDLAAPPRATQMLRSAFGFGSRRLNARPNVLRATLLASPANHLLPEAHDLRDDLNVLEANLDDCNPEWLGSLTDDLLAAGALDVWHTPIIMKKGRPAACLGVLVRPEDAARLSERIFRGTTTFGIRITAVQREALARRIVPVATPWGEIPVKFGFLHGEVVTRSPEHAACVARAREHGIAPRLVHETAANAAAGLTFTEPA